MDQIQGSVLNPFRKAKLDDRRIFFLIVYEIDACVSINLTRVRGRSLMLDGLNQHAAEVVTIGIQFSLRGFGQGRVRGMGTAMGIASINLTFEVNAIKKRIKLV